MVAHGSHPDLQVLSLPVDPKNGRRKGEIVVGAARAASEALRSTSARGGARVLVVDAADDLNRNAANTLLKLLEEPPHGVVMLLVAQRVGFVPVTIASRCARLRLRPLAKPVLLDALRSLAPSLAPEKAEGLAALAEGSPGRALQLARSGWLENYAALLTTLAGQDADLSRALGAAEALVRVHQSEGAAVACALLGEVLRRVARLSAGAPLPPPLFEEEARALECLVTRVSLDRVLALWDKLAALAGRLESLNLDPLQTFLPIVEAVTGGRASGAAPAPA
jgi:DNA polymerase-3 subunit delta'